VEVSSSDKCTSLLRQSVDCHSEKSFSESAAGFNEIGAELVGTDSKIKINGHFKKCETKQIFGQKIFSA
jgi:hypothetical protein